MNGSTRAAIAILLLYFAGVGFFVAFHPNGITMSDGKAARNPADVMRYFMSLPFLQPNRGGTGSGSGDQTTSA